MHIINKKIEYKLFILLLKIINYIEKFISYLIYIQK
jgi:hypothetical protein